MDAAVVSANGTSRDAAISPPRVSRRNCTGSASAPFRYAVGSVRPTASCHLRALPGLAPTGHPGAIRQKRKADDLACNFSNSCEPNDRCFTAEQDQPVVLVIYLTDIASFLTQAFISLFLYAGGQTLHAEKPKQATCFVAVRGFFSAEPIFAGS